MTKKVLVTSRSFGSISDRPLNILNEAGFQVDYYNEKFDAQKFEGIITDYDAIIIGGHKFPEDIMEKCDKLKIISKHGTGLDNIPLAKAKELGIEVKNVPGVNADAVADLAMSLILDISRKVSYADIKVHEMEWKTVTGRNVYGKTLGLLGFGNIAQKVARRAKGFDMNIMAYDPYIKESPVADELGVSLVDIDEIFRQCDVVSVHVPKTEETYHLISDEKISMMKKGSFIVNTARGGIVDEEALCRGIDSGIIAGAGLDVLEKEPVSEDNPLLARDCVVITPHIGMYSQETIDTISTVCAQQVVDYLK